MAPRMSVQEWDGFMNLERASLTFSQLLDMMEQNNLIAPTDQDMADLRTAATRERAQLPAAANPLHPPPRSATRVGIPIPPQPERQFQCRGSPFMPMAPPPFHHASLGPFPMAPTSVGAATRFCSGPALTQSDEDSSKDGDKNEDILNVLKEMKSQADDTNKQVAALTSKITDMEAEETPKKKKAAAKKGTQAKTPKPNCVSHRTIHSTRQIQSLWKEKEWQWKEERPQINAFVAHTYSF